MMQWLSGFLFNPALAAGGAAVAGPILIHILSRRRFRRVRWAAMEFLLDAQRRNRRRVRLEQLILLALRCLAVFLLAMMVARPFVRAGFASALIGAGARTERVFLIDDSFSMGYRPSGGGAAAEQVFTRATQAVERVARWIAADADADPLTVVLTSRPRTPGLAIPSLTEENLRRLRDYLDGLAPTQTPARMGEALSAVAGLIQSSPTQVNTAVYVVSDFQRRDWITPTGSPDDKPRSPIAPLAELAQTDREVRVSLIDVGVETPRNVAVADVRAIQPQIVAGVPARFEVAVANHSPDPLANVELNVTVAGQTRPPLVIPWIGARQTVREPLEVTFPVDGSQPLVVQLAGMAAAGDALELDNVRALAAAVAPAVRALIVDGEPSNDPYRDEVFLLKTAMRPEGRAGSGNEITVTDEDDVENLDLASYHVVILANTARLSDAARVRLEAFVGSGGGLVVFLGDQIDPESCNQRFFRDGLGLLPLHLTEIRSTPPGAEPPTIAEWDAGHPLMRAFDEALGGYLRQVRIDAFVATDETATSAATQPADGSEGSRGLAAENAGWKPAPQAATVVARFNDADRSPAIVHRPFGGGNVVLITTSVDQEWNDWAANFSYLPMMLELVQFAARQSDAPTQVAVGEPIVCPIDRAAMQPTARLRTPGYPVEPEAAIDVAEEAGAAAFRWPETWKSGLYEFALTAATGEPVTRYAAVNPDAGESDLTPARAAELRAACTEMDFEYVRDLAAFAGEPTHGRRELWWPLLWCAAAVLMAEHALAWWFGTRG